MLLDERALPVFEHVGDLDVVRDREREVHVGVVIAGSHRQRAHDGCGDHTLVLPRERKHALDKRNSLLDGEHEA
jgi:hypothetical protein